MCGIIGIWAKNNDGIRQLDFLKSAVHSLDHRGPDEQAYKLYSNCGLGHTRLSIIDTDSRSNQPFLSRDERYALVFNGEIYNYREIRADLEATGIEFRTESDTEVLLELLILKGPAALEELDGFFAFAFYDHLKNELFLARDRMGIKPLLVYEDENVLLFSSELTGFYSFDISKELNEKALNYYFSLTYIPAPFTILKAARKILPGTSLHVSKNGVNEFNYYSAPVVPTKLSYLDAKVAVKNSLKKSVNRRLVADVPLGSFLSGGLDSSIIAALAIQEKPDLKTFSIGFDHPYFDESNYADEVAKFIGSQHTVFKLSKRDFAENLTHFLDAIDEPFADSSAFAMYLLSRKTKDFVSVVLSGDGADELAGGYRKHLAEFHLQNIGLVRKKGLTFLGKLGKEEVQNRSSKWGELNRKLQKINEGIQLSPTSRYWKWCQFISDQDRQKIVKSSLLKLENPSLFKEEEGLNAILLADQALVLPNDMLKKVDLMSMASALEVRTPFLSHQFVELMNSLPIDFKLNKKGGKRILRDSFAELLPKSVLTRSKKGFEIPLKEWLNEEIDSILSGPIFQPEFLTKQGLFNVEGIDELRADWKNKNFGDRIYAVWALIVFQHWYNRHYMC